MKLQRQELEERAAEVKARAQRLEAQEVSATEQRAALAQREVELRSLVDELSGIDAHTNDMLSQVQQERAQTERSAAEMEVSHCPPILRRHQLHCVFISMWRCYRHTMSVACKCVVDIGVYRHSCCTLL